MTNKKNIERVMVVSREIFKSLNRVALLGKHNV